MVNTSVELNQQKVSVRMDCWIGEEDKKMGLKVQRWRCIKSGLELTCSTTSPRFLPNFLNFHSQKSLQPPGCVFPLISFNDSIPLSLSHLLQRRKSHRNPNLFQMNLFSSYSFFLSFLIFLFFPQISISQVDQSFSECSPLPFNCGNIRNVSYPFLAAGRPEICGYSELNLTCEKNSPEIEIGSEKYQIKDIDYEARLLTIGDAQLVGNDCPQPSNDSRIDDKYLEYTDRDVAITLFYNCQTPLLGFPQISCLGETSGPSYLAFMEKAYLGGVSTHGRCKKAVEIRVLKTMFDRLKGDPSSYGEVMKEGFEVQWKVGGGWCTECVDSGGICGVNVTSPEETTCFCRDGTRFATCKGSNNKKKAVIIGVAVAVGASLFIAACFLIFFLLRRYRRRKGLDSKLLSRNISAEPSSRHDLEKCDSALYATHVFSYKELQEATKNFDSEEELGDGGFGTVYYGKLRDGRSVAVKRLYENNYKRVEQFLNEVKILSTLRHRNLVTLYGCTSRHSRELLLVYEFISNGTVADHLHGNKVIDSPLTWPVRMSIAIETAEALAYLHAVEPPIIHRDVKTNNILLDNNFQVKVADFGLSRLFPMDVSHVSTVPQGTPGYVDPDYHKCYQLTDKSDVYSFGVVLVELISSMPAVDITRHRHEINLATLAINKIHNQALHELVDPSLGFETDEGVRRRVTSVAGLAFRCLQEEKEGRPSMVEVVKELKGIEEEESREEKKKADTPVDEVGLLKYMPPPSPDSVMDATWGTSTKSTTPNTSG